MMFSQVFKPDLLNRDWKHLTNVITKMISKVGKDGYISVGLPLPKKSLFSLFRIFMSLKYFKVKKSDFYHGNLEKKMIRHTATQSVGTMTIL